METFINNHIIAFTILAVPVVVTGCVVVLMIAFSLFGFEIKYKK